MRGSAFGAAAGAAGDAPQLRQPDLRRLVFSGRGDKRPKPPVVSEYALADVEQPPHHRGAAVRDHEKHLALARARQPEHGADGLCALSSGQRGGAAGHAGARRADGDDHPVRGSALDRMAGDRHELLCAADLRANGVYSAGGCALGAENTARAGCFCGALRGAWRESGADGGADFRRARRAGRGGPR